MDSQNKSWLQIDIEESLPYYFRCGHIQSIYASLCAPRYRPQYRRERIATPDDDFLDLDWAACGRNTDTLIILSHGLEGHTGRNYITGMIGAMHGLGYDCLAWNYRGCSGTPNKALRLYHNGAYDDLHHVIFHALTVKNAQGEQRYKKLGLIGFSLGGNMTLLYLGRMAEQIPQELKAAVAFSVPCDLAGANSEISRPQNFIYLRRFLTNLKEKVRVKEQQYPEQISSKGYWKIRTFKDFDGRYTAPIHGFASAEDYWQKCSCLPELAKIGVPSLMVNALDDSFLSPSCYPSDAEINNSKVQTLYPKYGGHVGFVSADKKSPYISEQIAQDFFTTHLDKIVR